MTKIFSELRALHNSEGHKDVTKIYLKKKKKCHNFYVEQGAILTWKTEKNLLQTPLSVDSV